MPLLCNSPTNGVSESESHSSSENATRSRIDSSPKYMSTINPSHTTPGHRGCDCRCACHNCSCDNLNNHHHNDAIQAIYVSKGGNNAGHRRSLPIDIPPPSAEVACSTASSSFVSISSEQRAPTPIMSTSRFDSPCVPHRRHEYTPNLQRYLDEVDEDPWPHFLDSSMPDCDVNSMADFCETESVPVSLEHSMQNNRPSSSGGQISLLPSLRSSLQVPSPTASAVIKEAGAAFGRQSGGPRLNSSSFLKLTGDTRG